MKVREIREMKTDELIKRISEEDYSVFLNREERKVNGETQIPFKGVDKYSKIKTC